MGEKDTTSPPKGRLRNSIPKLSTKTSESPRDKNCTATVTLDTQIPIIITKSESKTESGRSRSKDTIVYRETSVQTKDDIKISVLTDGDNSSLCCRADLCCQKEQKVSR